MYKRDRRRGAALFIAGGLALAVCLALIVFFVHILVLRTEYRAFCMEVNDAVLAARGTQMTVERGGESWPMSMAVLDYYNQNLMASKTIVFNRKSAEPDAKSITLRFSGSALTFTGQEDGTRINLRWESGGKTRSYTVRSEDITFMQYSAYLSNYIRKI